MRLWLRGLLLAGALVVWMMTGWLVLMPGTYAAPSDPWAGSHRNYNLPCREHLYWNRRLIGVRSKIGYEHIDGREETFYLFRPTVPSFAPRPVVVYIHGGALKAGSAMIDQRLTPHNRLMVAVERGLLRHGIDFVTVNYRLAPQYPWPSALVDAKAAVGYLQSHARSLHLNPRQMGVMGDSAGGELSSFVGLTMRLPHEGHGDAIRGVVDMFGPTDRRGFARQWHQRYGSIPNPVYGRYTRVHVRRESAVDYVKPGSPPFLIIQGTRDRIVPPEQSRELLDRLRWAGDSAQEILVHGAGHELVSRRKPISPTIPVLAGRVVKFFQRHLRS